MRTKLPLVLALWLAAVAAHAGPQDFTLVNYTGADIREVYISPSGVKEWGKDVLRADTLPDGGRVRIRFTVPPNIRNWDLRTVSKGGQGHVWYKLDLLKITTVTLRYNVATKRWNAQCQ